MRNKRVQILVEGSLMIAIAYILAQFKLFQMPQGGSISLSCLPLMLFSYRHGFKNGLFVCTVYGVFYFLLSPMYSLHPLSVLFDYILSYASIAVVGLSHKKSIVKADLLAICAFVLRFIMAILSGVIVFASYTPEGQNAWIYSIGYNSYLFAELLVTIIIFDFILIMLKKRNI